MRAKNPVIVVLIIAGMLWALILNINPGIFNDALFWVIITSGFWGTFMAGMSLVFILQRKNRVSLWRNYPGKIKLGILAGLMIMTALLILNIPRRFVFVYNKPAFEQMITEISLSEKNITRINMRIGMYQIDAHATDSLGGIFLRTHSSVDGLGPHIVSSGFAYKPNRTQTPFGSARYRLSHVIGDWYSFEVSDDY